MASGGGLSVSVELGDTTVIVTGPVVVAAGLLESVALMVTTTAPAAVGVPLTTQFAARVNPVGKDPAVLVQVYGALPPLTPIVPLYGWPTLAFGGGERVSV